MKLKVHSVEDFAMRVRDVSSQWSIRTRNKNGVAELFWFLELNITLFAAWELFSTRLSDCR